MDTKCGNKQSRHKQDGDHDRLAFSAWLFLDQGRQCELPPLSLLRRIWRMEG